MSKIPVPIEQTVAHLIDVLESVAVTPLRGFYLHGSIALGAYDERISDVDFLAVTDRELKKAEVLLLEEAFYDSLSKHPLLRKFEGNIISADRLQLADFSACPQCYQGEFSFAPPRDFNAVTLHSLREFGVTVVGESPSRLIKPVSLFDLLKTMQGNLLYLQQKIPEYADKGTDFKVFGVLTLCRILFTVRTGQITSKREAALYAVKIVKSPWREMIQRTLAEWESGMSGEFWIAPKEMLMEFVEYIGWLTQAEMKMM